MYRIISLFLTLFALLALPAVAAASERRVALVVGNSAYTQAPLENPRNDASDVAALLQDKLGFETTLLLDADQRALEIAIREFGKSIPDAQVRIFYYAGHGVSVNGTNYLIPIGADIQNEDDVRFEAVDTSLVLARMESAEGGANVMILDACRDNPLPRSTRSHKQGLNSMQAPVGSLILYATAPGKVALDGSGRNGTFTKHLLRSLHAPDVHIGDIALDVRVAVMQETGSQQVPWSESSLTRRIYLAGETIQPVAMGDSSQIVADTITEPAADNSTLDKDDNGDVGDYEDLIITAYRDAAEQGDAIAQSRLGYIFDTGRSTAEDNIMARIWYEKAVAQGDLDAEVNLGVLYRNGEGVPVDSARAFELFTHAAQANHPVGQLNLGVMYQFGETGTADYERALYWYSQAASQGNSEAYMSIGDIYSYGLGVESDNELSRLWYHRAAQQGSAAAQSELGYLYEQGIGVPQNYKEARLWFEKSAEQGYARAMYNLGELYEYGRGIEHDIAMAGRLYEASALQGDAQAVAALQRIRTLRGTDDQ